MGDLSLKYLRIAILSHVSLKITNMKKIIGKINTKIQKNVIIYVKIILIILKPKELCQLEKGK